MTTHLGEAPQVDGLDGAAGRQLALVPHKVGLGQVWREEGKPALLQAAGKRLAHKRPAARQWQGCEVEQEVEAL